MMKKSKKTVCMCVVALLSCLVVGTTAFAATLTNIYPYENVKEKYVELTNDTLNKSGTMTWSTRPTSGQSGAMIRVTGSDGSVVKQGFPYQISVNPMKVPMKKDVTYISEIRANVGTVTGNATQVVVY